MNIGIVLCRDREILYKLTLERNQMSYHFVNLIFFHYFGGEVVAIISQVKKMGQLFGILYISEYNTNSWDHSLRM